MAETAVGSVVRARMGFVVAVVVLAASLMGPARAASPAAVATKRVAVVLVNFRNDQSQPFSTSEARSWTFTDGQSVAALYRAVSYDRLAVTGDTYGWFTVDRDNGPTCDHAGWQAAADARSRQAGVDLDAYDVVVYAWPLIPSCNFSGASVGSSRIAINGVSNRSQWVPLVSHELGHSFGAEHADALRCTDSAGATVAISTTCISEPYGDPFDLMGGGRRRQPNANHKAAMGIMPAAAVHTVDRSGEYHIGPLATEGADPRLLRIPYDRDSDGAVRYLLLEFRQPARFDEFAADDPGVRGVLVRLGKDAGQHAPTLLVDTTPATPGNFADAPLAAQRVLTDRRRGLSIAVIDAGADGARVRVEYPGFVADWAACDGVTIPARVGRGRTVPFEARFRNTGSTTWTAADGYQLEVRGAEGSAALSAAGPVAPDAIGAFGGTLTAPQALGPVTVYWRPRLGGQVFGEQCTATVDVVADPDPPTPPQNLRGTVTSQSSLQLAWSASTDNVGVRGYRIERSTDGASFATIAEVTGTDAVVGGLVIDTPYWFRVVARDAGGNLSTPSGVLRAQIGDITAPSAPTGLRVTERGPGRIDLGWSPANDNVGVERYRVYRRSGAARSYVLVGETTAPAYRDSGLNGPGYSYYVVAVDRAGNSSARSNVVSASPATCVRSGVCA
jgi:chitodextrinase